MGIQSNRGNMAQANNENYCEEGYETLMRWVKVHQFISDHFFFTIQEVFASRFMFLGDLIFLSSNQIFIYHTFFLSLNQNFIYQHILNHDGGIRFF